MKSNVSKLIEIDSLLEPYRDKLEQRFGGFRNRLEEIEVSSGSLYEMSGGHKYFGLNLGKKNGKQGVWYREWAPKALSLALFGDFNDWTRFRHPMKKNEFGVWEVFLGNEYGEKLKQGSKLKVHVATGKSNLDRIPAYIGQVMKAEGDDFVGFWKANETENKFEPPKLSSGLRIYEVHVGMAQEKGGVGNYREFIDEILPRIKKLGYNAIQLMAIAEHPYYASFGYQVSNFFAPSHRFGEPDDLRELVRAAHKAGILVLMDLVHSHAVKNTDVGLNKFDGTDHHYFHEGEKGRHSAWDTRLFNYGDFEVSRFLLSNIRYWMEEFGFDGFRFDGVTSMLYSHHGLGHDFGHYDGYFDERLVDTDALIYLQLANTLVHEINPDAITIAEDVSGMPGLARPVEEGGLGFDYRLAMGVPDFWIKQVKHKTDNNWSMGEIFHTLSNRRDGEKHVGYVESHDQALVGDKTLAFRLMDKNMYEDMAIEKVSLEIDRGVALHKMIRLVTFLLSGEGYLNFIGNEFGHPEWIDFPREGNNDSFDYARRQWSLADNPFLKYQFLNSLDEKFEVLASGKAKELWISESEMVLTVERGGLVAVFNFNPTESYPDYFIGTHTKNDFRVLFSTDESGYGGFDRVNSDQVYPSVKVGKTDGVRVYAPSRTAQVLVAV